MQTNQSLNSQLRAKIAVLSLGLALQAPTGLITNLPSVNVSNNTNASGDDLIIEQQLPLVVETKPAIPEGVGVMAAQDKNTAEMRSQVKSATVGEDTLVASGAAKKKTEAQPTAVPTPTPSPTPIPTPRPAPVVKAPDDLEGSFNTWAEAYGVDVNLLKSIANCESHFHSGSVNGIYGGMFQFSPSTWASTRRAMGLDENPDLRFDGEEAIKTAAFKIGHGGKSAWKACLR